MKEYGTELELKEINIIENLGYIGLDKMETIAELHDVSLAELKKTIPKEYPEKFVKYHTDHNPKYSTK